MSSNSGKYFFCALDEVCGGDIEQLIKTGYENICNEMIKETGQKDGAENLREIAECFEVQIKTTTNEEQRKIYFRLSTFATQMSVFYAEFDKNYAGPDAVKEKLIDSVLDFLLKEPRPKPLIVNFFYQFKAYARLAYNKYANVFNQLSKDGYIKKKFSYFMCCYDLVGKMSMEDGNSEKFSVEEVSKNIAQAVCDFLAEVIFSEDVTGFVEEILTVKNEVRQPLMTMLYRKRNQHPNYLKMHDYLSNNYLLNFYFVQLNAIFTSYGNLATAMPIVRQKVVDLVMQVFEHTELGSAGHYVRKIVFQQPSLGEMVVKRLLRAQVDQRTKDRSGYYKILYELALKYTCSIKKTTDARKQVSLMFADSNITPSLEELKRIVDDSPECAIYLCSFLDNYGDAYLDASILDYFAGKAQKDRQYTQAYKFVRKFRQQKVQIIPNVLTQIVEGFLGNIVEGDVQVESDFDNEPDESGGSNLLN